MRVLVLGATGMLGNAMLRTLSAPGQLEVFGTVRGESSRQLFDERFSGNLISGVDIENPDSIVRAFAESRPEAVINCVGLVKQLADANDPLQAVPVNTLLPHRLAGLCAATGARLVQISTDCVFSGAKGNYLESDFPDAHDLYGRSKLLGEVDYPHAITLRTSIIGHEMRGNRSLLGWFLSQEGSVKGFTRAIFSGLPTVELATIIRDTVLPKPDLRGLYHVAASPIDKYSLLKLIARAYDKKIEIIPEDGFIIDRSLNAGRFKDATGYTAPTWKTLVERMRDHG